MNDARFPRTRRGRASNLVRWAAAAVVGPWRLVANRALWQSVRTLDDDELALPDLDRPVPGGEEHVQRAADGVGPLHVRRYRLLVATAAGPDELVAALCTDIDGLVPARFVRFRDGDAAVVQGPLAVGDEFVARLTGPADGPVRVIARDDGELRLVTLTGHVEAGEISFTAEQVGPDRVELVIRSWARSADRLVRLLYERGGGRDVQAHVWTSLELALVERVGGTPVTRVEVATRSLDGWSC